MVYLIHFSKPLKHARHYLGFSKDAETLKNRLYHHRRGSGSKLLRAVSKAGINWRVVRMWENEDGNFERKLKNNGHMKQHCPICNKVKNKHNGNKMG